MYRILEHQMQMVRDYLYDIAENHMDDSSVVSLLRQELMEYGIYDGDSLKWKSKDNKYEFYEYDESNNRFMRKQENTNTLRDDIFTQDNVEKTDKKKKKDDMKDLFESIEE